MNYFQGTRENPHHLSIGAAVRNEKGEVCCHYFKEINHPNVGKVEDVYILMRETLESNETIEDCLHRGLMEEFGIEAKINRYLGPIISSFPFAGTGPMIEKTTLYFLCDFISEDNTKRSRADIEGGSELRWLMPSVLVDIMKEQGKRLGRSDADESEIVKRINI